MNDLNKFFALALTPVTFRRHTLYDAGVTSRIGRLWLVVLTTRLHNRVVTCESVKTGCVLAVGGCMNATCLILVPVV